jgi:hypothetical protein
VKKNCDDTSLKLFRQYYFYLNATFKNCLGEKYFKSEPKYFRSLGEIF